LIGSRELSWGRILIAGSCANPGAGLSASPDKWLKIMQKA